MQTPPEPVILSGLADESAPDKTLDQQGLAMSELGFSHVSVRFVDAGKGIRQVVDLSEAQLQTVRSRLAEYGLVVWSIASPIGKIKLLDVEDGTRNRYVAPNEYLREDVRRACAAAEFLNTPLIRGFSFYHPRGTDPHSHLAETVDRLGPILDLCDQHGLTYGLEVEANLVGQSGPLLSEIQRKLNHPALVLVFDGANLRLQGYSEDEIWEAYCEMRPALGWLHIKDVRLAKSLDRRPGEYVDESATAEFVPVGSGEASYPRILADVRDRLSEMQSRLRKRRIPGVCLELEPHLRQGGQFGGYSGPDGMGIALEKLRALLGELGIPYGQDDRAAADSASTGR